MPQSVPERSEIFKDYLSLASRDIYFLKTHCSQKLKRTVVVKSQKKF